MNDATLYQEANDVQRSDAKKILEEFQNVIQWRMDGKDSLLDIGCGSGDVTIDFIMPLMPKNFTRLVGVDISDKMIHHAAIHYQKPKVNFKVLDISDDLRTDFQFKFDHITSFYCLHWVQDQNKTLKNIFDLLHVGGDCLLVFLANNPIFDAYTKLAKKDKWNDYMKDVSNYIAPFQYSQDPGYEFSNLLKKAGFLARKVQVRNEMFIYHGTENLKKNVKAVSPFMERMGPDMQEIFLKDYEQVVTEMGLRERIVDTDDYRYITPYKLIVAYARK